MEFLSACQKIISIDSSPSQGTVEIVQFLKSLAESMGFNVQVAEDVVNGLTQANITIRPEKAATDKATKILLQTHLDTIDPGSFALWSKTGFNPYQASIRGTQIYGLGAAGAKLDFLCKLYSFKDTDWTNLKGSAVLLGTFGEESRMRGAIKAVRDKEAVAPFALIGEPTDLNIVYAGKGIAEIEIIIPYEPEEIDFFAEDEVTSSTQSKLFHGRAAHSAQPEEGENAIDKMLDYLGQMPDEIRLLNVDGGISFNTIPTQSELEFDLTAGTHDPRPKKLRAIYQKIKNLEDEFKRFPNKDFHPSVPTINLGMIRTTRDHIQLLGAVRWSSHISDAKYIGWMKELAKCCKEQSSIFRALDVKRPFSTAPESDYAQACLEVAKEIYPDSKFQTQSSTNEANVFQRHGFECIVFGPGQGLKNIHTPEEHVEVEDLNRARLFYKKICQRICL